MLVLCVEGALSGRRGGEIQCGGVGVVAMMLIGQGGLRSMIIKRGYSRRNMIVGRRLPLLFLEIVFAAPLVKKRSDKAVKVTKSKAENLVKWAREVEIRIEVPRSVKAANHEVRRACAWHFCWDTLCGTLRRNWRRKINLCRLRRIK